jgi:hypothetical protein
LHDDSAAFNEAFTRSTKVYVPAGTYAINGQTPIVMPSNSTLLMDSAATLKLIHDTTNSSAIIKLQGVQNVTIDGGSFMGERLTAPYFSEDGRAIYIDGAQNITI